MKLLKCKLCAGEVDFINSERTVERKIKCRKCGFTNSHEQKSKEPEVLIIRKRPILD